MVAYYLAFYKYPPLDFNWRVLGRIENPKRASTKNYTFTKPSTVKYLQENGFFQSLEYNKSANAITDDVCVKTRRVLSHNSSWQKELAAIVRDACSPHSPYDELNQND